MYIYIYIYVCMCIHIYIFKHRAYIHIYTYTMICELIFHMYRILSTAWNTDCSKFAYGSSDKSVRIWNMQTGKRELTLMGHSKHNKECICIHDHDTVLEAVIQYIPDRTCPVVGHRCDTNPPLSLLCNLSKLSVY